MSSFDENPRIDGDVVVDGGDKALALAATLAYVARSRPAKLASRQSKELSELAKLVLNAEDETSLKETLEWFIETPAFSKLLRASMVEGIAAVQNGELSEERMAWFGEQGSGIERVLRKEIFGHVFRMFRNEKDVYAHLEAARRELANLDVAERLDQAIESNLPVRVIELAVSGLVGVAARLAARDLESSGLESELQEWKGETLDALGDEVLWVYLGFARCGFNFTFLPIPRKYAISRDELIPRESRMMKNPTVLAALAKSQETRRAVDLNLNFAD